MPENQLVPFADIKQMAVAVATSKLFGMQTPEQALTLMLLAQAQGMHPITAAMDYDIIQGRPSKKAEAMLRDFIKAGGKVEWHKLADDGADATFSHPLGGKVRISWDMNRAVAAELGGKAMWKKYPRQMFRSRCVSEGIKTVFPGATAGLYVPEEIQDFEKDPPKPPIVEVESAPADVPQELPKDGEPQTEPDVDLPKPKITLPNHGPNVSKPSEAQWKMLHAVTGSSTWTDAQVKDYIRQRWGLASRLELTRQEVSAMIDILKGRTYAEAMSDLKAFKDS